MGRYGSIDSIWTIRLGREDEDAGYLCREVSYSGPVPLVNVDEQTTGELSECAIGDMAGRYTVFDLAEIGAQMAKAKVGQKRTMTGTMQGKEKETEKGKGKEREREKETETDPIDLSRRRFERWNSGIDVPDSHDVPVHPVVLGYMLGDYDFEKLEEHELELWLREKLSPLVRDDDGGYVLVSDDSLEKRRKMKGSHDIEEEEYFRLVKAGEIDEEPPCSISSLREAPLPIEEITQTFNLNLDGLWRTLSEDLGVTGRDRLIPDVYMTASRHVRRQLFAGLIESCHTAVARGRFRIHRRHRRYVGDKSIIGEERIVEDIRALALSLGMDMCYSTEHKRGEKRDNVIGIIDIEGDIATIPCRLARLVEPCPVSFRSLHEIADVHGHNEDSSRRSPLFYSLELDGDGLFLREDYLVLGGNNVQAWPPASQA